MDTSKTPYIASTLGATIKALRLGRGMSQRELAALADLDQSGIARIERGSQGYSTETLAAIAAALGVKVIDLYRSVEPASPEWDVATRKVPLLDWGQLATKGGVMNAPAAVEIPVSGPVDPRAFALVMPGDSMEPRIPRGATIICEPTDRPAESGQVVVVRQDGDVTLREIHQEGSTWYLRPANPRYPVSQLRPDAEILAVAKFLQSPL